jgi:cytochrome P450
MEDWLYYSLSITFCLAVSLLLSSLRPVTGKPPLPPGPPLLWLISPLPLLFLGRTPKFGIEQFIHAARSRYGPIFTLYLLPSRPTILVADHAVAHRALVQRGAVFAGRPPASLPARIFSSNQHNIASGAYGPLWSVLRRNLTGRVFQPSCLRRFVGARRRAVAGLVTGITRQMRRGDGVVVIEGLLHRAMFHVLVSMCFGEVLATDGVVASIEALQREFVRSFIGFQVFGVCPAVTKLVYRRRWKKMLSLRRRQEELFVPLIRACHAQRHGAPGGSGAVDSYVGSLLGLRIPEDGGRILTDGETVSLCSEFLVAGTDSSAAVLQWIMANLVAQPDIQARLRAEIHQVAGASIQEEQLPRMPYLRAVVLEGLRRHPPGHFLLPHAATTDTEDGGGAMLEGFRVPRHASANFTVAWMGLDEAVWPDARRFRPERFLPGGEGVDVDLTGGKEIKMMPFGAGRRICPGMALALLHLEWFVASLVAEFEWREVAGEPVEFAEKQELAIVMRRPLRASVVRCTRNV